MKHISSLVTLSLLTLPMASGATELKGWQGRYPVESSNGIKNSIFNDIKLKSNLNHLLPSSDLKKIKGYSEALPIEVAEDLVIIKECKPHNCSSDKLMVVSDQEGKKLWVAFYERKTDKVIIRWFGNSDDYGALPHQIVMGFSDRR